MTKMGAVLTYPLSCHTKHAKKFVEGGTWQWFCKDICDVFVQRDPDQLENVATYVFANKMILQVDVL